MPWTFVCKTCKKEFVTLNKQHKYCSRKCAPKRQKSNDSEETKLKSKKSNDAYHETPEARAYREKMRRYIQAINKKEKFEEVNTEEWAVEVPNLNQEFSDVEHFFEGYSLGENW